MVSKISIECGNINLEGLLHENSRQKAAVICHPHPLYGGNMNNPVVMTISDAFFEKGFTTLRFNFRGTGNSTGMFDEGIGEQTDIKAAISFLEDGGYQEIYLAGYSFGARVNAAVVSGGCKVKDHMMVSPPAGFMSFDEIERLPSTGLIVTGNEDDIAPADVIQTCIDRWKINPRYEIINECDHFYSGCLERLKDILTDYLS